MGEVRYAAAITGRILGRKFRTFDQYGLVYLQSGNGFYRDANGNSTSLRPGDLIAIYPTVPHTYYAGRNDRWDNLDVHFVGPVFDTLVEAGILDTKHPVHHPPDEWYGEMIDLLTHPQSSNTVEALAYLYQFAALVIKGCASPVRVEQPMSSAPWMEQALIILQCDLHKQITIEEVARAVGLSYENFRKLFEKQVGIPPIAYRTQVRIRLACRLLRETDLSIRQVAQAIGLGDNPHRFAKHFAQMLGMSPKEYRKAHELDKGKIEHVELPLTLGPT